MDLTLPRFRLTRLSLPRWLRPAASAQPESDRDGDAGDAAAPASLHVDLGLPPADAAPPDAQSLRHALLGGGLW